MRTCGVESERVGQTDMVDLAMAASHAQYRYFLSWVADGDSTATQTLEGGSRVSWKGWLSGLNKRMGWMDKVCERSPSPHIQYKLCRGKPRARPKTPTMLGARATAWRIIVKSD